MGAVTWFENENGLTVKEIVKLESEYRIESLVGAIEATILKKEENDVEIEDEEFVVLAVESMEREVNSGGFSMFFSNDSWRFTPYLVNCLFEIRSAKARHLAELAVSALGVSPLTETTDVEKYYAKIQEQLEDETVIGKLEEIDTKYFEIDEDLAGLTFAYVKKNIASFTQA